jgi:2-iminobutanoate/2-iminopropanoate deaminase
MKKIQVNSEKAPKAIGPYSQAISIGNVIYTSGQIPINPETGNVVSEDVEEQTKQVIKNLKEVLEKAGSSLNCVIKTTVFIKNMDEFAKINSIYASFFTEPYPARSTVEVSRLPKDVKVEIEAIAINTSSYIDMLN